MKEVITIGIDLAKTSFTVCGLDAQGNRVVRKEFRNDSLKRFLAQLPKCEVFMEACGGAHYWSRIAMSYGHDSKIIAPQKVVAFRKNNKNDDNDGLAICIAGKCPGMEFVPTKTKEQQDIQALVGMRRFLVDQQTALMNRARGLLMEYGVTVPQGVKYIRGILSEIVNNPESPAAVELSATVKELILFTNEDLISVTNRIETCDSRIKSLTNSNPTCKRLQEIPGVGPIIAASIVSTLVNPQDYKNGRQYAASLGLTPKHVQTGGRDSKPIQLGISKHGNAELRSLLVQGALSTLNAVKLRRAKSTAAPLTPEGQKNSEATPVNSGNTTNKSKNAPHPSRQPEKKKSNRKEMSNSYEEWIIKLHDEKGTQKTAVAIANKTARIIHAVMKSGSRYNSQTTHKAA